MQIRTDLAMEAYELSVKKEHIGFEREIYKNYGFETTKIEVLDEEAEKIIGKSPGTYVTIDIDSLIERSGKQFINCVNAVSTELSKLLNADGQVLVAGIGNRFITPDSIGPKTAENILVTRHLIEKVPEHFANFRAVSSIIPGVLGMTGVESGEIISGVIEKSGAKALVVVDALSSRRLSRLLRTIQISNTGIVPGSGVHNARFALTEQNLGIPVISIGVPTVVDGASLACDILEQTGKGCEALSDLSTPVFVTTKDIDSEIVCVSKIIGYGINKALNSHLSIEDIDIFLS